MCANDDDVQMTMVHDKTQNPKKKHFFMRNKHIFEINALSITII
jgi:hypothetical protein